MAIKAVTFDFGQTLTELDCALLSYRLQHEYPIVAGRVFVEEKDLERALPKAWREYDAACAREEGGHPWHLLMNTLLSESGVGPQQREAIVEWLWCEQPSINLWRKPILGMIEIVRALDRTGIHVAVISNSEGKLLNLADDLGWLSDFEVIADSGVLGFAKPSAQIFDWTAGELGVSTEEILHIGDSWSADVVGIQKVGGSAIWFGGARISPSPPPDASETSTLKLCYSVLELKSTLQDMKLLP